MAISWGSWNTAGSDARIGWEFSQSPSTVTSSTTSVTVTVAFYIQTKYSVSDSVNSFKVTGNFSWEGDVSISHGSSGGTTKVKTLSRSFAPSYTGITTSSFTATWTNVEAVPGTTKASGSWSTAARPISLPAAPTSVTATRNSDTSYTVNWTNTNPTSASNPYQGIDIQRWDNVTNVWTTVADLTGYPTYFTDNGTQSNRQYKWQVRAKNTAGVSAYAESPIYTNSPAAPTTVIATKVNGDHVITWSYSGVTPESYEVERQADSGAWGDPVTVTAPTTTWTHVSPSLANTWTYRVRAVANGLTSAWSTPSNTIVTPTPPYAPTNLRLLTAADATTNIILAWDHNPKGDLALQSGFKIEHKLSSSSTWTVVEVTSNVSQWSLPADTYTNPANIMWRVSTKGQDPNYGDVSAINEFSTIGLPRGLQSPSNNTNPATVISSAINDVALYATVEWTDPAIGTSKKYLWAWPRNADNTFGSFHSMEITGTYNSLEPVVGIQYGSNRIVIGDKIVTAGTYDGLAFNTNNIRVRLYDSVLSSGTINLSHIQTVKIGWNTTGTLASILLDEDGNNFDIGAVSGIRALSFALRNGFITEPGYGLINGTVTWNISGGNQNAVQSKLWYGKYGQTIRHEGLWKQTTPDALHFQSYAPYSNPGYAGAKHVVTYLQKPITGKITQGESTISPITTSTIFAYHYTRYTIKPVPPVVNTSGVPVDENGDPVEIENQETDSLPLSFKVYASTGGTALTDFKLIGDSNGYLGSLASDSAPVIINVPVLNTQSNPPSTSNLNATNQHIISSETQDIILQGNGEATLNKVVSLKDDATSTVWLDGDGMGLLQVYGQGTFNNVVSLRDSATSTVWLNAAGTGRLQQPVILVADRNNTALSTTSAATAFNTTHHDIVVNQGGFSRTSVSSEARYFVPIAGTYRVTFRAGFVQNATSRRYLSIQLGGTSVGYLGSQAPAIGSWAGNLISYIKITDPATEYLQFSLAQNSGGTLATQTGLHNGGQIVIERISD